MIGARRSSCTYCGCPHAETLFSVCRCPNPCCQLYDEGQVERLTSLDTYRLLRWLRGWWRTQEEEP